MVARQPWVHVESVKLRRSYRSGDSDAKAFSTFSGALVVSRAPRTVARVWRDSSAARQRTYLLGHPQLNDPRSALSEDTRRPTYFRHTSPVGGELRVCTMKQFSNLVTRGIRSLLSFHMKTLALLVKHVLTTLAQRVGPGLLPLIRESDHDNTGS